MTPWSQPAYLDQGPVLSRPRSPNKNNDKTRVLAYSTACVALVVAILLPSVALAEARRSREHTVRRGQTLARIAARYGLTVDDLAAANKLIPGAALRVGRTLEVPRPGEQHFHVVRSGETAAQIARQEGCTVGELIRENKLRRRPRLRPGQILKLPPVGTIDQVDRPSGRRRHTVKAGESLNAIAHQHGIGTNALKRANGITNPRSLRPGQVLIIPEPRDPASRKIGKNVRPIQQMKRVSGERVGKAVHHRVLDGQNWRVISRGYGVKAPILRKVNPRLANRLRVGDIVRVPGVIEPKALRTGNCGYPGIRVERRDRKQTIRLVDCKGRVSTQGRRQMSSIAAPKGMRITRHLHPKLLQRLQRVADEFPGRPFRIISGYRSATRDKSSSRHNVGKALDFGLRGVPNKQLYDFCRRLPSTGCGYYPNSTFIHLDYREEGASWVDYSGPGEGPRLRPKNGAKATPAPAGASDQ